MLGLCLPALTESCLFTSGGGTFGGRSTLSAIKNSPNLGFLCVSVEPSSAILILSFSGITTGLSSSPGDSVVSTSIPVPETLGGAMANYFLILSALASVASFRSISCSGRTPLFNVAMSSVGFFPILSLSGT